MKLNTLNFLDQWGQFDGGHHKAWAIDQAIRLLCGGEPTDNGTCIEETDEYKEFVRKHCDGEDGPNTYKWDTGTPP